MKVKFDIDKIVKHLERYKYNLPDLYNWNAKIDRLVELDTLSEKQLEEINSLSPYEKEIQIKKIVGLKLNQSFESNLELFEKLCLWIVKDWGGIKTASDTDTICLIKDFLKQEKPAFTRIASSSKVGAYMFPKTNVIYDSRVAYALNWIILSQNAGHKYFPIPEGRNSKMNAFDLNVLIRLKHISIYKPNEISDLDHKLFINQSDKKIFIDKKDAYFELTSLIKQINKSLWKGDKEKEQKLYFTEMLLFSIADREVFIEITNGYGIN
ncbi:MAG: hypothetical protein Q8R90_02560 [Bacteroidales bacterium]|nr:hypothetical protein [Bacteroidales bacterium]